MYVLLSLALAVGPQDPHALVIGVDGMRSDALQAANTPILDLLAAAGSVTWDAFAGGPADPQDPANQATSSGPGWSSILTGVWADRHEVTSNSNFANGNFGQYPHMFSRVRAALPASYLSSIVQWHPINQNMLLPFPGIADHTEQVADSGQAVETAALAQLSGADPTLLFLHFDDVDHAGHGFGFGPSVPEYMQAIEETDAHIGAVLAGLQARPNYASEDWLVLITTDHGGIGSGHGGQSPLERRVWVIGSGGDVIPSVISPGPGHTVVPVTVFTHLGIPIDLAWDLVPNDPFGIPGLTVRHPHPLDGEAGLKDAVQLSWFPAAGAQQYDVYLGTTPNLGQAQLLDSGSEPELTTPPLAARETWYWRVDTVTAGGTFPGPVWSFETAPQLLESQVLHLDAEGDLADESGRGHDGQALGSPAFVPGASGQALDLDGIGDSVDFGSPIDLHFGAGTDFTVSLWMNADGWASDPVFISNKDWASGSNLGWLIAADPNGVSWQWNFRGAAGTRVDFDAIGAVADGRWHHLCVVHDRKSDATFYQDGEWVGERFIGGQGSIDSGLNTAFGQDGTLS